MLSAKDYLPSISSIRIIVRVVNNYFLLSDTSIFGVSTPGLVVTGVSLSDLLWDPKPERPSRVMRKDISESDIEVIYRQMANFLLLSPLRIMELKALCCYAP